MTFLTPEVEFYCVPSDAATGRPMEDAASGDFEAWKEQVKPALERYYNEKGKVQKGEKT